MVSSSELRARARESLGGGIFQKSWLYGLAVLLIVSVINGFLSTIPLIGAAAVLLTGPFSVGTAAYFINVSRRRDGAVGDMNVLFNPFKDDLGDNILLGVLYGVFVLLWSLLFFIPGIVKSYSYAMAYYIKNDDPNCTASEAITRSRQMMDGHKMELFLLDFSFIGWFIVGSLCCGIGVLWVVPYQHAARTEFYEALRKENNGGFDTFTSNNNSNYSNTYEDKTYENNTYENNTFDSNSESSYDSQEANGEASAEPYEPYEPSEPYEPKKQINDDEN